MDKSLISDHVKKVNEYNRMNPEAVAQIDALLEKIFADEDFAAKVEELFVGFCNGTDYQREPIFALAAEKGVSQDMLVLLICEIWSIHTKQIYVNRGWGEELFWDQILDISIWANMCHRLYGHWGLREFGWIKASLHGQIIRLGRLQFEIITMTADELPVVINGVEIKKGCRAINMHIPEGDSITKEKRLDSYKKAYDFFRQTGNAVFTCGSWLLCKDHEKFLPETSNIRDFMKDFRLLHWHSGNNDLYRVFGRAWNTYNGDLDKLPYNTGLQRAYVDWLRQGGSGGESLGVFVFDGENIYN